MENGIVSEEYKMLTIHNDWEYLTYKWNDVKVENISVIRYNHDGRNHDVMAHMRPTEIPYTDMGHHYTAKTNVLEVFIPMLNQWVEVTDTKYIKGVYTDRWMK